MSEKIGVRKIDYECKCIPFYELEEENESLKMQLRIISNVMRDNGFLFAEKSKRIEDLQLENEYLKRKFKQTLQEIKEIAEERDYLSLDECLDDILIKICEVEE